MSAPVTAPLPAAWAAPESGLRGGVPGGHRGVADGSPGAGNRVTGGVHGDGDGVADGAGDMAAR
jgi:hypothetical protein